MSSAPSWRARNLELELLDPHSFSLVRLFRHDRMDWDPPEEKYRNLRVDPPTGHRGAFAVLYTASTLATAAIECRVLNVDATDRYTWQQKLAKEYRVMRYAFSRPALFIPIDGRNREVLGLDKPEVAFGGYEPYQLASLEAFWRFGDVAHGLSWQSFHRNQPGRAYAIWHHRKDAMGLAKTSVDGNKKLIEDSEWTAFVADHPEMDCIS